MFFLFNLLFFFIPLVLYPYSYELFEFNKMVLTYALTILIVSFWLGRMIIERRIIFRRTILDIPLLLYLASQLLSTLLSIDPRTSLLGYYSRFNGGFLSTLSYSLLFWAFVSNMDRAKTFKAIKFWLVSGVIVSIYAVLQHFGIDKDVWVQDVQNRVFSTFGQPNWLAAWLVATLPLTWYFSRFHSTTALFTLALAYTKSRSGYLALAAAFISFWILAKPPLKNLIFLLALSLGLIFAGGTPWTPAIEKLLSPKAQEALEEVGPALEGGGTESGEIRKIVWKGAIDIWKRYPLFGSGVETFAFSYYQTRPLEHNLTSEWDFLYNKAHNEFLNILSTTGLIGLAAYLFLLFTIFRRLTIYPAFFSGLLGLQISNFLGFSVVPTSLVLFLFPAMALSLENKKEKAVPKRTRAAQKLGLLTIALATIYFLFLVGKYWYADFLFAQGKNLNDSDDPVKAREKLAQAIRLSPKEALFWDEISQSDGLIAEALANAGEKQKGKEFAKAAVKESEKALSLSPKNVNLLRSRANLFIKLSAVDPAYLANARDTLIKAIAFAPTDAKLFYNLGLTYARLGDLANAISIFEKTVAMKENYKDARLAYALILIDFGEKAKAREELNYILEKIDSKDPIVRQTLEEIK